MFTPKEHNKYCQSLPNSALFRLLTFQHPKYDLWWSAMKISKTFQNDLLLRPDPNWRELSCQVSKVATKTTSQNESTAKPLITYCSSISKRLNRESGNSLYSIFLRGKCQLPGQGQWISTERVISLPKQS